MPQIEERTARIEGILEQMSERVNDLRAEVTERITDLSKRFDDIQDRMSGLEAKVVEGLRANLDSKTEHLLALFVSLVTRAQEEKQWRFRIGKNFCVLCVLAFTPCANSLKNKGFFA